VGDQIDGTEPPRLASLAINRPSFKICPGGNDHTSISLQHLYGLIGSAYQVIHNSEVLKKARELSPDLVVIDIRMPILNGLEAVRLLRIELPQTKVLMMSQYDPIELRTTVAAAGADGCIDKGRLATDLVANIRRIVEPKSFAGSGVERFAG